jgi:hypothetical protein
VFKYFQEIKKIIMVNFGRKNLQKFDIFWDELEVTLSKKANNSLREKVRDKIFYNVVNLTASQVFFQTLNNLEK